MENKYSITKTATINADTSKVYSIWTDIEKWHLWTKSINKILFLENNTFEIGGKAKVEQPKLSAAIWTITDIQVNEFFTWQTKIFGVTIIAKHILKSTPNGTIAESKLIYKGFFARLFYNASFKLTSQYLEMEVNGLKTESEKPK